MRQGYLEDSGVDVVEEISELIEAQRGYELNSKVITTLPRGHIIERGDIEVSGNVNRSSHDVLAVYIGQEMRRTIYAGAKLNASHVDKPTLVRRNTRVNMVYRIGRLEMSAIGRALDEGGDGDIISVMNLESKRRVQGLIRPDGTIEVAK